MLFNKGILFYKFYNIRLLIHLLFNRYDLIIANDLDTLPAARLAALLKRCELVYDSHEYFTGVPELNGRPFVRGIWKILERLCFRGLKHVITVSNPIAELYRKEYGVSPVVIRNLSPSAENILPFSRPELGIPAASLVVILQGTGINIDKGAEELAEAVASVEGVFLIVAGSGDVIPRLKTIVKELTIENRTLFTGVHSWHELMRYTKTADAGMALEKNTNLNYRFSLPNKLFDYIAAGLAVVASDLPEMSAVVNGKGCGIVLAEISAASVEDALKTLRDDKQLLDSYREKSKLASNDLSWEPESERLKEFYLKILEQPQSD
jgi:glycosyltransferase involved in cell wall biosynthesis